MGKKLPRPKEPKLCREKRKTRHDQRTAWIDEWGIENPGMRLFLVAYERIGTITGACRELGYGCQKVEFWRDGFTAHKGKKNKPTPEGERFGKAMLEAKQRHIEMLEMECELRGIRGSDNLLMFKLKAELPEKYRESWKTANGPNTSANPTPVQVQINQLIQTAIQDPDKLSQVMELAKKHGLLDRLVGPELASTTGVQGIPLTVCKPVADPKVKDAKHG